MVFQQQFDSEQWATLQLAPFFVLSGVSGRYRGFGVEELLVFERWLDEASRAPGTLSREVLGPVSRDLTEYADAFERYDGTIVSGLTRVGEILVGQPPLEVELFREALISVLGMGMATARGPYGREATVESQDLLTLLDEFLRPGVVLRSVPRDAA